ncbi:MAG: pentapeptide repeat-containing protein [Candidatus Marinimicrobia bacterium]|nr:pentapeptide repeat-containing protein [Candidatus Neomarinimicrobiota bacterium]
MGETHTPLTRTEVERLYKEQGTLAGADLRGADLSDIYLITADLSGADLSRADLTRAHMYGANLQGARLFKANLEQANLNGADLRNCDLLGAIFRETKMSHVILDKNFVVINEREAQEAAHRGDKEESHRKYEEARDVYRSLKVVLHLQIPSKDVGILFVREMSATRKLMPLFSLRRLFSKFLHVSLGYGEQIGRIIGSIFVLMIGSAILYGFEGVRVGDEILRYGSGDGFFVTIAEMLYFSVVVFTTVGFGDMTPYGPLSKITMMVEGFTSTVYMAMLIIALYKRSMAR